MPLLTSGDAFRACSCERRSSASDQVMRSSDVAYLKMAFVAWLQPSVATNFSRKTDQNSPWAAQPSTLPAGRLAHGADVVLLRARRHRVGVYKAHGISVPIPGSPGGGVEQAIRSHHAYPRRLQPDTMAVPNSSIIIAVSRVPKYIGRIAPSRCEL